MLNPSLNRGAVSRKVLFLTVIASLILILPLAALRAPFQVQAGRLAGGVYDANGKPIANATVTVANEQTKTRTMTTTNDSGVFDFLALPVGAHQLQVIARGFRATSPESIAITANSSQQRTVTMQSVEPTYTPGELPPAKYQRIRKGGNVLQADLLEKVQPRYPAEAREARIQGVVIMEGLVGPEGEMLFARVVSGHPLLTKAAIEAVGQWRYKPQRLNGQPIEVVSTITVTFSFSQ